MNLPKFFFNLAGILIAFCTFSKDSAANTVTGVTVLNDNKSTIISNDHGCGCGCGSCTENEVTIQEKHI